MSWKRTLLEPYGESISGDECHASERVGHLTQTPQSRLLPDISASTIPQADIILKSPSGGATSIPCARMYSQREDHSLIYN